MKSSLKANDTYTAVLSMIQETTVAAFWYNHLTAASCKLKRV